MTWFHCIFLVGCLIVFGCDEDPARSVKIIARPAASMKAKPPRQALSIPIPDWRPNLCPPPDPTRGSGTFVAKGACNFEQHGPVDCTSIGDDFIFNTYRPAAQGATLAIYVNVENYHGPDKYEYAQMLVSVNDLKAMYRWRSDIVNITVGEGEKFVVLEPTRLEPILSKGAGTIDVAGKLWCRPSKDKTVKEL